MPLIGVKDFYSEDRACGMVFTVTPFRLNKGALVVVTGKRVRSDVVVFLTDRLFRWSVLLSESSSARFPTLTTVPSFQFHTHNTNTPILNEDGS